VRVEDREVSEFLHNIRNDMLTAVNLIIGYSDALLSNMRGPLDEELEQDLQIIRKTARQMSDMADSLAHVGSLVYGVGLKREQVDLASVFRGALRELSQDDSIQVGEGWLDSLPTIQADRLQAKRIVGAILSTAADLAKGNPIDIAGDLADQTLTIRVTLTGVEIPSYYLDRFSETGSFSTLSYFYFSPLFDLYSSQLLVEANGGEMQVINRDESGVVILFTLATTEATPSS